MKQTVLSSSLSLSVLLALGACADRAEQLSTTAAPLTVLSQDCDVDAGYALDSYAPAAGTLQIVGIYEARNGDAPWWSDPACSACLDDPECGTDPASLDAVCQRQPVSHAGNVHVTGLTTTLVLASYEPTDWTVTAGESSALTRVILSSYLPSTAVVPEGVTVETADLGFAFEWYTDEELAARCEDLHDAQYCEGFGDYWYEERQASADLAKQMVAKAEALSGDKLGTFHGCYSMSSIAFGARQP